MGVHTVAGFLSADDCGLDSARLNTLGAEGSKYELVAWVFRRVWGAL